MPFVPLGARKRYEVILDDDKVRLAAQQRERDLAALAAVGIESAFQAQGGGYRFAKHPATLGPVRPEMPFKDATSVWKPPEIDPDGPAGQRQRELAEHGARWEFSHGMKSVRSSPSLQTTGNAMMEAHPMNVERRRVEMMSNRMVQREMRSTPADWAEKVAAPKPVAAKRERVAGVRSGGNGLVNFPKYMLIHNCWLKQQDAQRFQREQEALWKEAERQAAEAVEQGGMVEEPVAPAFDVKEASWGAPRQPGSDVPAGSSMPAGRGQRTSNPFRTG